MADDEGRRPRGRVPASLRTRGRRGAGRARAVLESGLFDPWYYDLQIRKGLTGEDAAAHYATTGAAQGMLPNGFSDLSSLRHDPEAVVSALLDGTAARLPVRDLPGFEVPVVPEAVGRAVPGGAAGAMLLARGTTTQPFASFWSSFVRRRERLGKALWPVLSSGHLDRAFYERQTGLVFHSDREAAWHYLEVGEPSGLLPNVLFVPDWYRRRVETFFGSALGHFVRGQEAVSVGPHLDAAAIERSDGEGLTEAVARFLAQAGDATPTLPAAEPGVVPTTVGALRERLLAAVASRPSQVAPVVAEGPVAGRTSVLLTCSDVVWGVVKAATSLSDAEDVEIVVVDGTTRPDRRAILVAALAHDPRVRIVPAQHPDAEARPPLAEALAVATGEHVVVLQPRLDLPDGWLPALQQHWREHPEALGVRPVTVRKDGAILSAGVTPSGRDRLPDLVLEGFPLEDAARVAGESYGAACGGCLLLRADDVRSATPRGPVSGDMLAELDLTFAIADARPGAYVTAGDVVAVDPTDPLTDALEEPERVEELCARWSAVLGRVDRGLWERAGFAPARFESRPGDRRRAPRRPVLARPERRVEHGPAAGLPSLRWAIKIAAPAGPRGDTWGDHFFAHDLARALRGLGQEVVVDRRQAHDRPGSEHLDDVTVNLRGLDAFVPSPGSTNVLWVISHPDEVDVREIGDYDLAYAASLRWSASMTRDSGREVAPLLQALDPARFSPEGERRDDVGVLFVGRTRGVFRPIVRDALAAGADLDIFGSGWEKFIARRHVRDTYLDNAMLPIAYRSARVVLNDHWADMSAQGFLSNRLFEAVASGVRVVSDEVQGLHEVFGSSVRTYGSTDELAGLLAPDSDGWPTDDELVATAHRVRREHSFQHRAAHLLGDVLAVRGHEGATVDLGDDTKEADGA